ncbi:hypothetical protein OG978_47890 (plasmid) [Streptomyces sp. NBC_01591]|uniref:hypothetical protein n=1 Tax=Streptomyces sp. NBC_01591 TaxID=2975888 RepID=UPI002DD7EA88|nr:hypothetical protein [Streptomyces sp. NBC_01591]WSD74707.1 hypothetical protein OG978_47890 [Streptomyces sp. NBC_01591]
MNIREHAHASCVQSPVRNGSSLLPTPAVVIIVVVVSLTAGLAAWWQNLETVIATITIGGLLAVELVRRTVAVFSAHRV